MQVEGVDIRGVRAPASLKGRKRLHAGRPRRGIWGVRALASLKPSQTLSMRSTTFWYICVTERTTVSLCAGLFAYQSVRQREPYSRIRRDAPTPAGPTPSVPEHRMRTPGFAVASHRSIATPPGVNCSMRELIGSRLQPDQGWAAALVHIPKAFARFWRRPQRSVRTVSGTPRNRTLARLSLFRSCG